MKTIMRYSLAVLVAVMFSWGLAPNEVRAIASPCEQLAGLDNEIKRLEERRDEAKERYKTAEKQSLDAQEAVFIRCDALGVPRAFPQYLLESAAYFRSLGREREALRYEAAAKELLPYAEEATRLYDEYVEWKDKHAELEDELNAIPERRRSLMEECGLVTEMADPMASSGPHEPVPVEPEPVPSGPQMAQPAGSENQASANEQATQRIAPPTIPAHLMFPGLSEAAHPQGSSAAAPSEGQTQSSQTLTGQTMQVQQETTNTGTNAVGYTHMPIPQRAGQSVAPQKTLRAIPHKMPMRIQPGRSFKK